MYLINKRYNFVYEYCNICIFFFFFQIPLGILSLPDLSASIIENESLEVSGVDFIEPPVPEAAEKPVNTSQPVVTPAESVFKPYYEHTFLVHNDELQCLLSSVEQWITSNNKDIDVATQLIKVLVQLLRNTKEQVDILLTLRNCDKFTIARFEGCDSDFRFWTGFYSYVSFKLFWTHYVEPNASAARYWGADQKGAVDDDSVYDKPGPKRRLAPIDELFLTLVKLKRGSANKDLGDRFCTHETNVSKIFITWVKILHMILHTIDIWMPRSKIKKYMPSCFKPLYKDVRVIVDCTEIRSERPSDFDVQCATYSSYKGCNTHKALVGISPSGVPTFISQLYEGSISDNDITNKTKLRDLFEPGDAMMADRGWTCANWLARKGVRLVSPHFLNGKQQLSIPELVESVCIARVRIHVERCMGRIKQWLFLKQEIPLVYWNSISDIFQVCARLVLFWPPLLSDE